MDMTEVKVDCRGKNCPVPLVEMRKALRKANNGDIVEIVGTHPASKKEIPMAVQSLGQELMDVKQVGDDWVIRIKKVKE
jgi:TusA-related sulfurtransferase